MIRVLTTEIKKLFKSPMLIGYFVIPMVIMAITYIMLKSMPIAFTSTVTIQTVLIAFVYFGINKRDYQHNSLAKKVHNSKIHSFEITITFVIISLFILLATLIIPMTFTMLSGPSLKYFQSYNDYLNPTWAISNVVENADKVFFESTKDFSKGLIDNMIMFNFSAFGYFQLIFAFTIQFSVAVLIANIVTTLIKKQNTYFAFVVLFLVLIIIFSSLTSKRLLLLGHEGQYVIKPSFVSNITYTIFEYLNPFYWTNQLLMCSTFANSHMTSAGQVSGIVENTNIFTTPDFIYNIFHFGTTVSQSTQNLTMDNPVINGVEMTQILMILLPVIWIISTTICSILIGDNK